MCGIAGFVHLQDSSLTSEEPAEILERMIDAIAVRGPNGRGAWHDGTAYLAHARLSIIDLSESSSQPMRLEDDELVMVYNGEIYNYQHLKEVLVGLGESFFSSGDTEVLLRGFKRFGTDWLRKLNGMFAGAIWNKKTQTLTLFRDRFGIKPLYWTIVDGAVLFASQIKSFQQYPHFKPQFNLAWLNEYLTFQNTHGSITPFSGVELLEPGQTLVFQQGKINPTSTKWAPDRHYTPDGQITADSAVRQITELFSKAVQNTLVSDVPVGSYLSGGIDSGAVVAIASQFEPQLHTFTCGFDDAALSSESKAINELADARALANIVGCNFHEVVMTSAHIPTLHQTIFRTVEEPRVGVFYQNDLAAKLASQWVRVCLSGAGGDELFGGYPWRYKTIRDAQDRTSFLKQYYGFWQRVFRDEVKSELLKGKLSKQLDPCYSFERFASQFPEDLDYGDLGLRTWLCLKYESQFFLHGLLQIGDRLAGAYGLEERFPFLDNDLISFLDTIPGDYHWDADEKPADGQYFSGKRLLRQALTPLVPETVTNRRKQGFVLPEKEWFGKPLTQFVHGELLSADTRLHQYIEPASIERSITNGKPTSVYNRSQLWSLLSVEAILKEFFS